MATGTSKKISVEEATHEIDDYLAHISGDLFDVSDEIYHIITKTKKAEQYQVFQYVCPRFGTIHSDETRLAKPSRFKNSRDKNQEAYGTYIDNLLNLYLKQNLDEGNFYQQLWNSISENAPFDNAEKKIFALYYILIDDRIPYFHVDEESLYTVSEEEFNRIITENRPDIQKVRFLILKRYEQTTEMASAILSEFGIGATMREKDKKLYDKYLSKMIAICGFIQYQNEQINDLSDELKE